MTGMARLKAATGPLVALAAGALVTLRFASLGDYPQDAGPPIRALLEGHLGRAIELQPLMGGFAVLARLPFAALALVGSGSELFVYRLGALPCVAAASLLGIACWRLTDGRSPAVRLCFAALCILNPPIAVALGAGHPEEILGGALAVAAVLLAVRGRTLLGALALGLALATKQWALLAVLPFLLAVPGRRGQALLVSGSTAALLTLPFLVGDLGRFSRMTGMAAATPRGSGRETIWWLISSPRHGYATSWVLPGWVGHVAHPLILFVAVPLSILFLRRGGAREDALGLLALVFLLRCILDPVDNAYYHVPFLLALVAWEALRRETPLASALAAAGLWLVFSRVAPHHSAALANASYLAVALCLAAYLVSALLGPGAPAASRLRPGPASPSRPARRPA
jgi:hypothetical protein